MAATLTLLGIESSCDDTGAAVVRHAPGARPEILSNVVASQTDLHAAFGGVVPEIAARAHAEKLDLVAEEALAQAGLALRELDGIAVTAGPGLIGGVLSGVMLAKGLSAATGLPLVGVNHLAGHALTPRLTDDLAFPYLMLLVSGGHCQFLRVDGPEAFTRLGGTIDDAPGEAFDKTAKLLGLPQPGGPHVETEAARGDPRRFAFPRPLLDRPGCDLSFSGLKTALMRARDALVAEQGGLTRQDRADLCAGFQAAVADVLAEKSRRALAVSPGITGFAVAGGGGGEQGPARTVGAGRGRRAVPCAAPQPVHRQRGDDRVGRDRTDAGWAMSTTCPSLPARAGRLTVMPPRLSVRASAAPKPEGENMPHFALICTDKPGHLDTRKGNRDAHLAYLSDTRCVTFAGPFLRDGAMTGSLVVIEVPDRAAAEAWAANDPYAKAGLFDTVRIEEWKKVVG